MPYTIRPYTPSDEPAFLTLWSAVFGEHWPLDPALLRREALDVPTYRPGDHLLAERDGQLVGFALTQVSPGDSPRGSLLALGVHPGHRRCGIGTILHAAAMERLSERGAIQVQLGAGALGYLWPGVPADLPAAWPFFHALGWPEIERSFDLVCALDEYATPAWIFDRTTAQGIMVDQAAPGDETAVVDFLNQEMPAWARFYAQAFHGERAADVIIARSVDSILGVALAESRLSRWEQRFIPPVGAPGAILTSEAARDRGIGMALAARASEVLKARGCRIAFIGWTWLVDWYGKLGCRVWQEYIMSWTLLNRVALMEKMRAGRVALANAIDSAPRDRPVLNNGWTARDLLVHLAGWEDRIADAYQALSAGQTPIWDLDRLALDEVNELILTQAGDLPFSTARAAEERAHLRLLEIARSAPDPDLFDPARFAWMKSVHFAEWIGNNTFEHIAEHLIDWV